MKKYFIILFLGLSFCATLVAQSFGIRGVLPWHNFLSGPSAWNEKDYEQYLDECRRLDLNFIAFHCYTGGGERYASYVEPLIKISYRNILPAACLDHSMTARWGYLPLSASDFAFETNAGLGLPEGAKAFGADCSVLSQTITEHYDHTQALMQKVVVMAHERGMQVAMGFEFGVVPPEYFSLSTWPDQFYWLGEANMLPNPTHEVSIELLYAAIDNIIETYPAMDWIGLWLNEHCFMGVDLQKALTNTSFKKLYDRESSWFTSVEDDKIRFIGVWSLQYIRLAYDYIQKKSPKTKIFLSGWGGGNQLPAILQGLDKALPKDIVFSCLNPDLGNSSQSSYLSVIARNRQVWAIPWLEGDHQLWHLQPRVNMMKEQVQAAASQGLQGVLAIHWRTEETRLNLETFAQFAHDVKDRADVRDIYSNFLKKHCGEPAAKSLPPMLTEMDVKQWHGNVASPEFYAFTPQWGQLDELNINNLTTIKTEIDRLLKKEKNETFRDNLLWLYQTIEFELLLDQVCRNMQPAWNLRRRIVEEGFVADKKDISTAKDQLEKAPVERMFRVFAVKARSRGELGILSSLNQKLWVNYTSLYDFVNKH